MEWMGGQVDGLLKTKIKNLFLSNINKNKTNNKNVNLINSPFFNTTHTDVQKGYRKLRQ